MEKTLYQRLGAKSGIAALVDDVIEAHMKNPVISARFLPYREMPQEMDNAKGHLCDFFGAGSGGPEDYTGRSMPEAHRGMNIGDDEYMAAIDDIMATLEAHGIDEQTRKDVLMITYSLKAEIVRQ
ncbi:group I truncated hemoglobin [Alloyangia pacifica]|uniref:group I truncated hemoglobin n=1 Tax=Alloyangia pacifica TaxID=311180 RepID=UPI001CD4845D|nr:group 1 truncated hemoglobin [Alloyangia pacifica]MCA0996748.1 group 1 truncated hemoglobin [Alloyangia pacifica]